MIAVLDFEGIQRTAWNGVVVVVVLPGGMFFVLSRDKRTDTRTLLLLITLVRHF